MSNVSVVLSGSSSLPPPPLHFLPALVLSWGLSLHLSWSSALSDQLSACQHEPFCTLKMLSLKINLFFKALLLFRSVSHEISRSRSINKPKTAVLKFMDVTLLFVLLIFLRTSTYLVSQLLLIWSRLPPINTPPISSLFVSSRSCTSCSRDSMHQETILSTLQKSARVFAPMKLPFQQILSWLVCPICMTQCGANTYHSITVVGPFSDPWVLKWLWPLLRQSSVHTTG